MERLHEVMGQKKGMIGEEGEGERWQGEMK